MMCHAAGSSKWDEEDFLGRRKEISALFFEVAQIGFSVNCGGTYNE
jgi:hypothetical protein